MLVSCYLDGHGGLLVIFGGEKIRRLGGYDSVPRDQLVHDSTNNLNTKGEGSHVKEKDICINGKTTIV